MAQTKELSIETKEKIVKLIPEVWHQTLGVQRQRCLKFGANINEMRWIKKENIQVKTSKRHSRKFKALKIVNIQNKEKRNGLKQGYMFVRKL